jgi:hypothetical protein
MLSIGRKKLGDHNRAKLKVIGKQLAHFAMSRRPSRFAGPGTVPAELERRPAYHSERTSGRSPLLNPTRPLVRHEPRSEKCPEAEIVLLRKQTMSLSQK